MFLTVLLPVIYGLARITRTAAGSLQGLYPVFGPYLSNFSNFLLEGLRRGIFVLFLALLVASGIVGVKAAMEDSTDSVEEEQPKPDQPPESRSRSSRFLRWLISPAVVIFVVVILVVGVAVVGVIAYFSPGFATNLQNFFHSGVPFKCLLVIKHLGGMLVGATNWARTYWPSLTVLTLFLLYYASLKGRPLNAVFENLNLHKGLVNNYYLKLNLFQLFQENDKAPVLGVDPFPVVLVAAPLQVQPNKDHGSSKDDLGSYQIWPKPGTSLIEALCATLAVPGLYDPVRLTNKKRQAKRKTQTADLSQSPSPQLQVAPSNGGPKRQDSSGSELRNELEQWETPADLKRSVNYLDLADGTVIRQNPLPALFNFIAKDKTGLRRALSTDSAKESAKIHAVYSVPIVSATPSERQPNASIVDVGLAALKLSRRRDTQLEVHQTNLLSKVEQQLRRFQTESSRINPIFVDEIAPERELQFKNPMSPTRDEVLTSVAAGCRATLEVLYAEKLAELRNNGPEELVPCEQLIRSELIKPESSRAMPCDGVPGLSEVCAACTKMLKAPCKQNGRVHIQSTSTWASMLPDSVDYPRELPQLRGDTPRIVFVASGGVFRGSFHAGMIAALLSAHIKPDLIVGASVGTIMGGALAAVFCADSYKDAVCHLEKLTAVLLAVDKEIAFTKPFKNAMRDLAIRARGVDISPDDVRRMVLHGSQDDASFAAVGAPSALIDGISHLLLIPHRNTGRIAAEFVAGHVTLATRKLLQQLKRETLKRLNIEFAVIGTSLIEPAARRLLRIEIGPKENREMLDLRTLQPYRHRKIAVYGTTIDYWLQRPVLLGAGQPDLGPSYDFVEAVLSSSAFPCVFATRRQSDVYPGTGSSTTLFCDGGMFDNLPFLPAMEILSKVQTAQLKRRRGGESVNRQREISVEALKLRCQSPDLLIAGSLDVNLQLQDDIDNRLDNIVQITKRASSLQHNVKIKSYEQVLLTLDEQLGLLAAHAELKPKVEVDLNFIDQVVNASLLPVYPADSDHLNGTFEFCASTGLDKKRLKDSMSNGCFQTLRAFVNPGSSSSVYRTGENDPLKRTLTSLTACNKVPRMAWNDETKPKPGICRYFKIAAATEAWPTLQPSDRPTAFPCPFYEAARLGRESAVQLKGKERRARFKQAAEIEEIYRRCITDPVHMEAHLQGERRAKNMAEPLGPVNEDQGPRTEVSAHTVSR